MILIGLKNDFCDPFALSFKLKPLRSHIQYERFVWAKWLPSEGKNSHLLGVKVVGFLSLIKTCFLNDREKRVRRKTQGFRNQVIPNPLYFFFDAVGDFYFIFWKFLFEIF